MSGQGGAAPLQHSDDFGSLRIAAIVPCHNEEVAVGKVVDDLRAALPTMGVYVYDNCSTDATRERASEAGAHVRSEEEKGKGNVVRRAFGDLDADVYLLIDGDDTYDAAASAMMIRVLLSGPYDHVVGVRTPTTTAGAYRPGHERGNRALNGIVGWAFGTKTGDMLSGYRAFSRRFVKSFPAVSREFEIETELTVHSLALRVPQTSVPVGFKDRPGRIGVEAANVQGWPSNPDADHQSRATRAPCRLLRVDRYRHGPDGDHSCASCRDRVQAYGIGRTISDIVPRTHASAGRLSHSHRWPHTRWNPQVEV